MKHSRASLKETIRLLEIRQAEEKDEFNKQLKTTFDSLKPANLIKSTFKDITNQTELKNNIFEAVFPLMTSFISGKVMGFGRKNSFYRIIATMLQMSITNYTARHSHSILEIFSSSIEHVKDWFNKAKKEAEEVLEEQEETVVNATPEDTNPIDQTMREDQRSSK
ncbi:hypothetical protein [Mangrovibacterium diazotrophicum]|uniref:Uncharacterized protein n=1 Tax=Mangrovibacterium diazotrophicum TaxID=1261403 RepID=A0A419W961_9BACT|nr:hypothetical protein [Mangrovibacterium diazotrophicum]RKD92017.1 hypothetical protein BC643_2386 [Mangrovibacterium diazotrophicum]